MKIIQELEEGRLSWYYWLPALIILFLTCFFVTKCELDSKLKVEYQKEQEDAKLDSILYTSQSQLLFYKRQAKLAADSARSYKQKVRGLDSLKKLNVVRYEKPLIQYRASLLTNPDSARKEFLSKRFPDLYPH